MAGSIISGFGALQAPQTQTYQHQSSSGGFPMEGGYTLQQTSLPGQIGSTMPRGVPNLSQWGLPFRF